MESRRVLSVRAFDDGVDRWEMVEAAPAPSLRGLVDSYSDYWEQTGTFSARRELAATTGVLIYVFGEPLEIVGADGQSIVIKAGEGFAGGIADATSVTRAFGAQAGVHAFLPLASLAAVTGAPLSEIANRVVPMRDLIGAQADALGGALCDSRSAEQRFGLLDAFLADRFSRHDVMNGPVSWAMDRLVRAVRPVTSRLAEEIGWSRRHFIGRFRAATGFSPDRFRRLARFERFADAIMATPGEGLAGLAADCGYVDQAHLTRDVRAFSDMTPGELRARLLPNEAGVRHD